MRVAGSDLADLSKVLARLRRNQFPDRVFGLMMILPCSVMVR